MSSKKKTNGCTSVQCVSKAIEKCGCTPFAFFHQAAARTDLFDVQKEVARFERFKENGISAVPGYTIPKCVLELADKVLEKKSPRNFFQSMKTAHYAPA